MFHIRPVRVPDDYSRMAELFTFDQPEPVTEEHLAEEDSRIPEPPAQARYDEQGKLISHCRSRLMITDEKDYAAGYAQIWRAPWSPPGWMIGYVLVDAAYRGEGLGQRLLEAIEGIAREKKAEWIYSEVRDHYADSIAWLKRRGYEIERHAFESTLDLSTFDESRFAGAVEAVQATGIRFTTLAEEGSEPLEQKLYQLFVATESDIPGFPGTHMPFSEWRKWNLEGDRVPLDGVILALDGDRVVGTTMLRHEETGAVYTTYTGVDREYRGRKLALALKLLSARVANRYGAPYMRTNNDSTNEPMLAVNRKLGYQPEPGLYRIRKQLV